jgi:hypothetical protein
MNNIPSHISEVFEKLKIEVTWLHVWGKIYRQLFAHSGKRIDLLNECASTFFYLIQETLINEVQVYICKLTDHACTGRNENLSFEQLQRRVEEHGEIQLSADLQNLLDELYDKSQDFRTWRNKRLAHLDINTVMQSNINVMPEISHQMIEEALRLLRKYMNTIDGYYSHLETDYENFHMPSVDGEALVFMLKFAVRYKELLKDHKLSFDDFEQSQWWDA